jgi:hypothetical protein
MKKTALLIIMLVMGQVLTLRAENTDVSGIDNVVYINPVSVQAGTTQLSLPIYMKNTAEIRGLQFDLYLPEGATIEFNKKGKFVNEPVFNEDRLPEDDEHTIQGAVQGSGAVRFLINSQYEETFTGNDGVLFTVTVTLSADMAVGDYPIEMKSIKLSESDINNYYTTEVVKSTLSITSTTKVSDIISNDSESGIYNLSGQKRETTQKGINIIDGRKILIQ